MPENNVSNYDASHSHMGSAGYTPSNDEIWKLLQTMNDRLNLIEHRHSYVATAFPKNDLGKPDYDGHRKEHLQFKKDSEVVESYQNNTVKSLLSWAAVGAILLFIAGLVEWIRAHLK